MIPNESESSFPPLNPVDCGDKSVHNYRTTLFGTSLRERLANRRCIIYVMDLLKTLYFFVNPCPPCKHGISGHCMNKCSFVCSPEVDTLYKY